MNIKEAQTNYGAENSDTDENLGQIVDANDRGSYRWVTSLETMHYSDSL